MEVIDRNSILWSYMGEEIKGLIEDGETILTFVFKNKDKAEISDYSFVVFPFAKAYEGFLKKFLLDAKLIKEEDYYGDDIRIGRILNPNFVNERSNVFQKICDRSKEGSQISKTLWAVWRRGRNRVFHYFPHNYRRLSYDEALDIINEIVAAMNSTVAHCRI